MPHQWPAKNDPNELSTRGICVGCSGYDCDDWAGRFYPEDIRRNDRFDYHARYFDTVEIGAADADSLADLQCAVEVRDPKWLCKNVYDVLREFNAALVIHDLIDDHPRVITADFVYLRFHGAADNQRYAGSYSSQYLTARAKRIKQ